MLQRAKKSLKEMDGVIFVLPKTTSAKPANQDHVVTTVMEDTTEVFVTLKKHQNDK